MDDSMFIAVILILNLSISLIGTIGNGAVIVAFIVKRRLRTRSNSFIIGLISLSFIHCTIFYPILALIDIDVIVGLTACFPIGCFAVTSSVAITLCLLATSVERYIAICWPLSADAILTRGRTIGVFLFITIYSVISGIIFPGLSWIGYDGGSPEDPHCTIVTVSPSVGFAVWFGINLLTPIPIMFLIYFHIFLIVRRHAREIDAQIPGPTKPTDGTKRLGPGGINPGGGNKVHPQIRIQSSDQINTRIETHMNKTNSQQRHFQSGEQSRDHIQSNEEGHNGPTTEQCYSSSLGMDQIRSDLDHSGMDQGRYKQVTEFRQCHRECRTMCREEPGSDSEGRTHLESTNRIQQCVGIVATGYKAQETVAEGEDAYGQIRRRQRTHRMRREVKSAIVIFAIIVLYALNFIPYVIYLFTSVLRDSSVEVQQFAVIHAILLVNYALNPYIYGFGNRTVRESITQCLSEGDDV